MAERIAYVDGCECRRNEDYATDNGCVEGEWYGYCSSSLCGGFCEPAGPCECPCHAEKAVPQTGGSDG